ncbi:MAG TPA: galactokinase [Candidatus Limnocylindria bacterium]|nr:galactokinase [Candidatus Limnocylindria bacterium]
MPEASANLPALVAEAQRGFTERFGRAATRLVRSPGRVNLIGEHLDYNDGPVLPLAIGPQLVFAAAANGLGCVRVWSAAFGEGCEISLTRPFTRGEPRWSNYLRGVLAGWRQAGLVVPGFDVVIVGDLPAGGGLSSSAALEVGTATLLEALTGTALVPEEKALLCQRAEHDFAGLPCGFMDQFACVFGRADHLLLLDCRSRETTLIPWTAEDLVFLVIDTQVKHDLATSAYAERRRTCEDSARRLGVTSLRDWPVARLPEAQSRLDEVAFRRVRHVVTEIARTFAAASAIQTGAWSELGRLMTESHASLRDDYEVSCAELDEVVRLATELGAAGGVIGCRMTGGGFGGSAIALVRREELATVQGRLQSGYACQFPHGLKFMVTRAANGVSIR